MAELSHGKPHMAHKQELLATLGGGQKSMSANTTASVNGETGTILSIQETSAGAIWGVAVTVQITATNEILTRFINKRIWANEDAFRADVKAALTGKPTDYNIPWSVVGTWF